MNKHLLIYLFLLFLFTSTFLKCAGQKIEPIEIPVEGKMVYVEGIRGEGYLTANPFGEMVLLDSRSQTRHVLTWDGYYYAHPNVTSDRKSLIFESKRAGNIGIAGLSADSDIYRMDLETKDITNLNEEISSLIGESLGHRISHPSLSPSGTKLAMVRLVDWQFHLSYYDFDRNEIIDLSTEDELNPVNRFSIEWSGDEAYVMYTTLRGFSTYVLVFDIKTKSYKQITNDIIDSRKDGEIISCLSGSWIDKFRFVYLCSTSQLEYSKIYEFDVRTDSSKEIKIVDHMLDFNILELKINRHGNRIILIGREHDSRSYDIYMMNLLTDELIQITYNESEKRWLKWYEGL